MATYDLQLRDTEHLELILLLFLHQKLTDLISFHRFTCRRIKNMRKRTADED